MPGAGPHRSSEFAERCRDCGDEAIDACFRCNRPWCASHSSLDADLCRGCDEGWLERKRDIEMRSELPGAVKYIIAGVTPAIGVAVGSVFMGVGIFMVIGGVIGFLIGIPIGAAVTNLLNRPLHRRANAELRRSRVEYLHGLREKRLE